METEAHALWQSVLERRFSWDEQGGKRAGVTKTVGDWVENFKNHHLKTTNCTPRTFEKHWEQAVFDRLPKGSRLSEGLLLSAVWVTPENTRERKQVCQKLSKLAEFAGVAVDLKPYQGNYGTRSVQPRTLPTDEQIEAWRESISNKPWRRIYSRIVLFGLRPSESFFFELLDPYTAQVEDAKSGEMRITKAFHPRWAENWEIAGTLPKISWRNDRRREDVTQRISTRFRAYKIPCQRYDFRHAWCVRVSVEYRIPVEVAAKWAGHSPDVHQSIYARWIRGDQQEQIYRNMALKPPSDVQ